MIAGIDLGTTHSLAGVMDSGFPVLVADQYGSRLTPSAVYFSDSSTPKVGWPALEMKSTDGGRLVTSVKRLIGRRASEPIDTTHAGLVSAGPGGSLLVDSGHELLKPEEISALVLAKLKTDLESSCGCPVDRAVITVPAYFNDAQRAATKRAGELAGFTVERILSEPTAAALAYGLERLGSRSKVAVYDLGGGTFDISVLELDDGVFEVLSTNGDTRLGGDDLNASLAAAWGLSIESAMKIKHLLTDVKETEFLGRIFLRSDLERICRPVIEKTRAHCLRSLADAGLANSDLNAVVLVGGATRMPLVREFVAGIFGREPDTSQHPDEAIALGATIQAGILAGAINNITLLDVTPLSLGIETFGGLMNVLIPRNTTIPCKAGEMFTNAATNQTGMRISILQGEREMASDNWKLGEMEVNFGPAPKGQSRVGIQFELDADGILRVLARDTSTGRDSVLEIQSAIEVADEAVEKMLGDSLDHAFEDMDERVFIEAKLKAEEMLPAVKNALSQLGEGVDPITRDAVAALVCQIHEKIAVKSTCELKAHLEELDQLTEPLAAALVESLLAS